MLLAHGMFASFSDFNICFSHGEKRAAHATHGAEGVARGRATLVPQLLSEDIGMLQWGVISFSRGFGEGFGGLGKAWAKSPVTW